MTRRAPGGLKRQEHPELKGVSEMEQSPLIQRRAAQPYVAIPAHVSTEAEFRKAVDRGFPELFGWLRGNRIEPSGPPFIRYLEVAGEGQPLRFELAAPTATAVSGDERVQAGEVPAGRYATFLHVGPYNSSDVPDLRAARAELLEWGRREGIEWDASKTAHGTAFEACIERYLTDSSREPDWSKWETELAYLIADSGE
jgi:effector-binding domain-containing protein